MEGSNDGEYNTVKNGKLSRCRAPSFGSFSRHIRFGLSLGFTLSTYLEPLQVLEDLLA